MTRAVFLVSKHPYGRVQDGETVITRLLLSAAAAGSSVRAIALADEPAARGPVEVVEVPKPPLRLPRLAAESVIRRRSLIHTRFAPAALRRAVEAVEADVLVARRTYMAQAAVDADRVQPVAPLAVLVDVLESMVLRRRRSPLGPALAVETRRTRRDELRCIGAASAVAYFSDAERAELPAAPPGPRLDLVLPAASRPSLLDEPLAVFVGDRRWPPNADALRSLVLAWPRIAAGAPGARLLVIGRPGRGEGPLPAGADRLGYVDDLDELLRRAGVLLAPVRIGGGVRVKILDAASHGLPVVGTEAAVGSTASYLPIVARDSDDDFVDEATRLLADPAARRADGDALYEANRALNERGFVERQVADLLDAAADRSTGAAEPERGR